MFPHCHWNLPNLKWKYSCVSYSVLILCFTRDPTAWYNEWIIWMMVAEVLCQIALMLHCKAWGLCTASVAPLNSPKDLKTVPIQKNHHFLAFCFCLSLTSSFHMPLSVYNSDCSDFLSAWTQNECDTNNFFSISVTVSSLLDYMASVITFCSLYLSAQMSRQDVLHQIWENF